MSIETIAVLGAGQMGSGIAQIAAASGYKVIIRDIKQEFCDKGVNGIKAGLDKQVAKGKTTQEAADAIMARISTTVELEGVAPADFVIEAAPEILVPEARYLRAAGRDLQARCHPVHQHLFHVHRRDHQGLQEP